MLLPSIEDPHNCADPRNLGQSEWDQKFEKIECVYSLYEKMRWKWDDVYLLRGLPNIYSPSRCRPQLPLLVSPYTRRRSWKMCLEAMIECVWRYTGRLRSRELRDALGGRDEVRLEMHLEVKIEWTQRCPWRPRSSEFGHALGGRDRVNSEMHLEAPIERLWRCTWRPRSSELRDALRCHDQSRLEEYMEAVDLEVIDLKAVNLEAVDWEACAMEAATLFIC